MNARPRALFLVGMLCGLSSLAHAQNASTPGAIEFYPTFQNIGVRLGYSGDANANAVAHLEWRVTGAMSWVRGVDMTRISGQRWAGSVLWLLSGQSYDVRAVIEDPDGGGTVSGAATTRSDAIPGPSGRSWYVAVNGNDNGTGDPGSPLATLQAAVDRALPGDAVVVKPGVYYQTVTLDHSGSSNAPLFLLAEGPGVVLDGSDPAYLQRNDWRNDGGGIYSLPFAAPSRLVCVDSLQRLFHVSSLAALQGNTHGLGQGWVIESGRLSIQLEGGSAPTGHVVHVARYDIGIRIESDHWIVRGFEVRNFGTLFPDWDYVSGGITLIGAHNCVVSDCHVHTIGGRNIFLRSRAADNLIERNLVRDPRLGGWPWETVKGTPDQELTGISVRAGRGNVIRSNTITGTFNGVDARLQEVGTDEDVTADTDYQLNWISNQGDDAVEIDEVSGINVRILWNRMNDVFVGFSLAPIEQGPTYVLYNTVATWTRSAFKLSGSSVGIAWICHNSCYGSISGEPVVHPSGPYSNLHFRNNIFMSQGSAVVSDDSGESQTGNDFDADCLYAPGSSVLFRWKNQNYGSLSALQSATGFETHAVAANPLFVSASSGDLSLQAASPCVDRALRLAGINDLYTGGAPDMGALERGLVLGTGVSPVAEGGFLEPPSPNPLRGLTRFDFHLPRESMVSLAVFDPAGRRVRDLIRNERMAGGSHKAWWDGTSDVGRLASGVYYVRLVVDANSHSARVTVLH